MTVFFAATPTGRAIAESVIQYIATLFEDGSLAFSKNNNESGLTIIQSYDSSDDEELDESDDTETYLFLNSFDDFIIATGKTPVVLPLPCTELYYVVYLDIDYLELHSSYETTDGVIVAYQIWDVPDAYSFTLAGYTEYDSDGSLYYSIEESGDITIKKILEDSYIGIVSKGKYTLNDLIEILKNI
jgi:hypothetical protein